MKKIGFFLILGIVLAVVLLVGAFFYIDLSGHNHYVFGIYENGVPSGEVTIDRYAIEGKIVYKSVAEYTEGIGYSRITQKLHQHKNTNTPIKFEEKAIGENGAMRLTLLLQDSEKADYLFLDKPVFLSIKGFNTGEKTLVFTPESPMLYFPIMEKYNYWKKGSQFFEIEIPIEAPVLPMREKLQVQYLTDEYILIMGEKHESEKYLISANGVPKIKVHIEKYSHRILKIDLPGKEFVLAEFIDNPWKRIKPHIDAAINFFKDKEDALPRATQEMQASEEVTEEPEEFMRKEIFFENDDVVLRGVLYSPKEDKDIHPLVVFVQDDGALTRGENAMVSSLSEGLATAGAIVLTFNDTGKRITSRTRSVRNDPERISNVKAAVNFLSGKYPNEETQVVLVGYKGGGYIALKTMEEFARVNSCIMLGIPSSFVQEIADGEMSPDDIQTMLKAFKLGPFNKEHVRNVSVELLRYGKNITGDDPDRFFRDGIKLPVEDFAEYLNRNPYEVIKLVQSPLLFIFGRNDVDFNQNNINQLKKDVTSNPDVKIASFRELGPYMGDSSYKDGRVVFRVNDDVEELVLKWVFSGAKPRVLPLNTKDET